MSEIYGRVYVITNKVNGRKYVGQTVRTIQERFKQHVEYSFRKDYQHYPICRAIKKHGKENFLIELLEECFTRQELNKSEIKWIKDLKTNLRKNEHGYNLTSGGESLSGDDNPFYGKKHSEKTRKLISEKSKKMWLSSDMRNYLCKKISEGGRKKKRKYCEKIDQYDLYGNFIMTHESIEDVKIFLNSKNSYIVDCCKGNRGSHKGFVWRFYGESFDKFQFKCNCKEIIQMDLHGNLIKSHPSMTSAAKQFKSSSAMNIIRVACVNQIEAYGFMWKFKFFKMSDHRKGIKKIRKKVIQISMSGEILNIFNTIKEASDSLMAGKVGQNSISRVCKGRKKNACGFNWKYSDEDSDSIKRERIPC